MIPGCCYCVTTKIKLHTSPLRELEYDRAGVFVKETPKYLIFDEFRVSKENIVNIRRI